MSSSVPFLSPRNRSRRLSRCLRKRRRLANRPEPTGDPHHWGQSLPNTFAAAIMASAGSKAVRRTRGILRIRRGHTMDALQLQLDACLVTSSAARGRGPRRLRRYLHRPAASGVVCSAARDGHSQPAGDWCGPAGVLPGFAENLVREVHVTLPCDSAELFDLTRQSPGPSFMGIPAKSCHRFSGSPAR